MLAAIMEDDAEDWTDVYLTGLEQTGRLDFEIKPMNAEEYNEFCSNMSQNPEKLPDCSEIYLNCLEETGRIDSEIEKFTVEELNSMWKELYFDDER